MTTVDHVAKEFSRESAPVQPSDKTASVLPTQATDQNGLPLHFQGPVPALPASSPARTAALVIKRILDLVLASLGLLTLWPLLLLIAVSIKMTSKGPLLFGQLRTGLDGKPFTILKFRTMHLEQCDHTGLTQTTPDDSRVTPLGRFMRRMSLDELPQLLNVLAGDMSIVGPRPHPLRMLAAGVEYERLVPYYEMRHVLRPGITGWAQANGLRGPTTDEQAARARIDNDIAYIQNFSIWLDLKTIWLTVKRELLRGTGV